MGKGYLRRAGMIGLSALLAVGVFAADGVPSAYATTYPTWADVVAARKSEAATQAEVTKIKADLADLNGKLTTANADAQAKGEAAAAAVQKYDAAKAKQQALNIQEQAAAAKAAKSRRQIGEYAAQLARGPSGGGGWSTTSLLVHGKTAGQLLNNLGAVGEISKEENGLLQVALAQQHSVNELLALSAVQANILNQQKQAAAAALALAAEAAKALQDAVEAAAEHQQALTVELTALTTQANMTEAQYNAGVAAAEGAGQAGVVDDQGWARPTVGLITSPWGYRFDPAQDYEWAMHYGDDIADGCLRPIYAAAAGTVTYAGVYSDYGNYIMIDHGNGVSTAYGHIANGETFVHVGQTVTAGQNIARTGSTGASTGCHLYFAVSVGGGWVNPVPFMSSRGISLGGSTT